ncbi:MAG: dihydroorotase [Candidatus Puniceispirillales bacterium]|jgi:dihydroorotase|tara:strand:- start:2624 stop:3949 length:1326 start_codon:yes stop_codon:yes gene_type:complete
MTYTIFKSIKLLNPATNLNEISDVVIHKNKIFSISKDFQTEVLKQNNQIDIYDCDGLTMTPGIIDMRVNIGKTENLVSTQKIAAENGITSMVILPNQTPKLNNPSIIDHIKRQSENSKLPKVNVYGAATKDDQGLEMSEIGLMSEMGAIGFTNGNKSIKNSLVMRRLMSYAAMINRPIIQHAEDEDLSGLNKASTTLINGEMNEGEISTRLGLIGIPSCAEVIIIERDIRLAKLTGVNYHVAHVSTRDSINVIREAKKAGLKITCDTAPPYFSLNETSLLSYNTAFKLSPPLRIEDDRLAVIEGIQDGTIDAIASDHRARSKDTKVQPFSAASIGASGIETLFVMTLELVHKKIIDLNKAISLLTTNPANVLNMKKPSLEKDELAEFIIFDENFPDMINQNNLKTSPTPFDLRKINGKILGTFINGQAAYISQMFKDKIIK